ncbi:MAG: DUF2726 domain-containing protein [Gammaproteobacteria bacterium]|nr:DUF2726 domain-containing protein [Gammaproteobacteria bacterium]MBU1415024.1 DUF2726 domain-containing protein [Gammaproteobacteria bacterium]
MKSLPILVVLFAVLVLVVRFVLPKLKGDSGREANPPYFAKKPLTDPEREMFARLQEAMPECVVLAQVALSSLVGVKERDDWRRWFNRISQKSVDFVLCLPQDFTVVAVIELDDISHTRSDRQRADTAKDVALRVAGHPIIRFKVQAMPAVEELRAALAGRP